MCRREIPPEFLDHPQLVNGIEDICTTKATDDGYQWFYEGRNGKHYIMLSVLNSLLFYSKSYVCLQNC